MSEFECNWCSEYGMHSPNCPYIGDRSTRRVCYECWDWAGVGA